MRLLFPAWLFLAACATPEPGWDVPAEARFRELERRWVESESLRWTSESPVPRQGSPEVRVRTEASFQGADRFKVVFAVPGTEGFGITVQSDGREFLASGLPHGGSGRQPVDVAAPGPALRRFFFRVGFTAATYGRLDSLDLRKPAELDAAFSISDFRYGEDGRVAGRDAKSICYRLRVPGVLSPEVTLWVDPRTLELLRRDIRDFKGDVVSETFSRTDFAASFPADHFDLPKEAK